MAHYGIVCAMKSVDVTEVHRNFVEITDRVRITGEGLVVYQNGRPLVAIVPVEETERLQRGRGAKARGAFNRASIERLLDRAQKLPILDARSANEILGYGDDGLPI
jgi:prevent-host-death family protein